MYYQRGTLHGTHSFDKPKSRGTNRSTNCVYCNSVFCLCRRQEELKGRGGFNTSSFVHCRNEFCQLSLSPGYWWKLAAAKYSLSMIDVMAGIFPFEGK